MNTASLTGASSNFFSCRRPIFMDKMKFGLDNIFGMPYGSRFEVDVKAKQLVHREQDFSLEGR